MKVRNLVVCALLGASQLQANFITDGYNRLYNAIVYLVSNQRVINNAIDEAVVRAWSDKVIKQNGATCGFDAYKNGKWVYQFLAGRITKNGLFDYLQQQPEQTAYQLSAWQQRLHEDNDLDDGQLYALREQDKGIDKNDFVVIPTVSTFGQNIANNDFSTWNEPLVYVPHVANALHDIRKAIIHGTRKTVVFILGNMAPEIRANNNIANAYGHWIAFVVNVRNSRVTLFSLDSSQKATIVPDEFQASLEQVTTSFKQLLKMNPNNIRTSSQHLIAQQLPNLLQDAYNYLYTNDNPVGAINTIETLVDHYKNLVGTQAGQSVNDQAGLVLNMLVEIMHKAVATDNNGLAQRAAHCISTQPFADIVMHQIVDDNAKKQFVLKAHTLLIRFPQLIDNSAFVNLVGTIAQQYPELEQHDGQELFPTPAARIPAPCCLAPIKQEQLQAAVCPACGSDQFGQLVQAQNPQQNAPAQPAPAATAITPCCFQEIPQEVLMAELEQCPLCDSDQFTQLVQAQNQASQPARNNAPSAPPVEELAKMGLQKPSLDQMVAEFKHEAQQNNMTSVGYAIYKQDLDMLGYILVNDKPSIYNDEFTKSYIVGANDNDQIANIIKTHLADNNLECPICMEDMQSVNDFHFYKDCAHHVCKSCQISYPNCTTCNDTF